MPSDSATDRVAVNAFSRGLHQRTVSVESFCKPRQWRLILHEGVGAVQDHSDTKSDVAKIID
jgi:hypothetical protein